jgi:hypothetical protein
MQINIYIVVAISIVWSLINTNTGWDDTYTLGTKTWTSHHAVANMLNIYSSTPAGIHASKSQILTHQLK